MLAQPSMIKRPVLDVGGTLLVGFKPEEYAARCPEAVALSIARG
jgi:arsenate reductase-like glutaredoxin family protein